MVSGESERLSLVGVAVRKGRITSTFGIEIKCFLYVKIMYHVTL